MSETCLVFQVADPQAAHCFYDQPVEFICVGAAAGERDTFAAIDRASLVVFLDKSVVARLLDHARDFVDGIVPRDVVPMVRARAAHLWFRKAALVENVLFEGGTFRTERPAVDRVIGITFDVDDLWTRVLGFVAEGVNDHTATDGTVGAGASGLTGARDLERLSLRIDRREVEAEGRCPDPSNYTDLDECSSRDFH